MDNYDGPYQASRSLASISIGPAKTLTEQVSDKIHQLELKLADEKELLKLLTEEPNLGRAWDLMLRRNNY